MEPDIHILYAFKDTSYYGDKINHRQWKSLCGLDLICDKGWYYPEDHSGSHVVDYISAPRSKYWPLNTWMWKNELGEPLIYFNPDKITCIGCSLINLENEAQRQSKGSIVSMSPGHPLPPFRPVLTLL